MELSMCTLLDIISKLNALFFEMDVIPNIQSSIHALSHTLISIFQQFLQILWTQSLFSMWFIISTIMKTQKELKF
jgi:hypothetical protein